MSRRFWSTALAGLSLALTGCDLPTTGLGGLTGPIGTIRTNADPAKTVVAPGESITLWIEPSGYTYRWSATSGSLSATSGPQVVWTAGAAGTARITCVVTSGTDTQQAEYRFTVR